jgi:DNA-binding NarL/FixJ family response regulator
MRIAILEDDQVLRDSLTQLLGGERDTMVVGSYGSAEQALEAVESASPELSSFKQ